MLQTKRRWRGFPPSPQLPVLAVHQADSQNSLAKASNLSSTLAFQPPRPLRALSVAPSRFTFLIIKRRNETEESRTKELKILLHSTNELLSGRKQVQQKGHRTAFNL